MMACPNRPLAALMLSLVLRPALCLAQADPVPTSQPALPAQADTSPAFFIWPEPARLSGPISTDRPGYSDSASLVPRGHVQMELGYIYAYDRENHSTTNTNLLPNTSLRIGLLEDFELRVDWGGASWEEIRTSTSRVSPGHDSGTQHEDGTADMSVGFKAPIVRHTDANRLPNLSIIPALSLPTGSANQTTGDVNPSIILAWNYPIADRWLVYGVGSIAALSSTEGWFLQESSSLAVNYSITEQLSMFVEYFGIYPAGRGEDCQYNIDGGPIFLLTDNIQLDFSVGMGLNEQAPDFFTNMGVSIRF